MKAVLVVLIGGLLALPAVAAEGGGEANIFAGDLGNMVWTVVVFVLLLVVLGRFAWGPILERLQARESFIRESLEEARRDRLAAEERLAEYEARLAEARGAATAIVDEGRRDAEVVRRGIEADARAEAKKIVERARREIELAKDAAVKEIYGLAGGLATAVASQVIRKELDTADHARLIAEAAEKIRQERAARGERLGARGARNEAMAAVNERSLGVARLYARAMLTVAEEQGAAHELAGELQDLLEHARRDGAFGRFLASPVLERGRRRESLERALRGRASDLLVDSLQVINKKDRLAILDQILAAYREAHRELLGQVEAYVSTAVPLSDEQRADIRDRAARYTGKEVVLVERVDEDMLGGVIVQIGDQKVDMSVRRDLELLAARFATRLSKEMLGGRRFGLESGPTAGEAAGSHDGRDEEP